MRLLVVLAAGGVAGLIALLPAQAFEASLNRALAPAFQLAVSGSVWRGDGELIATAGGARLPLRWRFDPAALLRLRAGWRLDIGDAASALRASTVVALGLADTTIGIDRLDAELSGLGSVEPVLKLAGLAGRVSLTEAAAFALDRGMPPKVSGSARLAAERIGAAALGAGAIGSARIDLAGDGEVLRITVADSKGAAQLQGKGQVGLQGDVQFSGTLTPAADAPEDLKARLQVLSPRDAQGRHRLEYRGRW